MHFDNPEVEREYRHWVGLVGADDPYATLSTCGLHDVLNAHFAIVDFFATENRLLGGVGPKSLDLLHSAVYRQFVSYGGKEKWPNPIEKCATLLYGLVKDHPFHDANKRTAFLTTVAQLRRLDKTPQIKQREFEDFVVDIAEGSLSKRLRYKQFANAEDPEICYIADFLRRSTRSVDKTQYTVTFNELKTILRRYGLELSSPSGNYIDVVRVTYRSTLFGLGRKQRVEQRIAQVGFPGWKRQVTKQAIKTIREAAGLTQEHGFDSKSFYEGADPLYTLLDEYEGPLRRLADR